MKFIYSNNYDIHWYTGHRGIDSFQQLVNYPSWLYLTQDVEFARVYGPVWEIWLRDNLKTFDTANGKEVDMKVRMYIDYLLQDKTLEDLVYESNYESFTQEELYNRVYDEVEEMFTPADVKEVSFYDGDLTAWLWETFEYQLITFNTTAIVVDCYNGLSHGRLYLPDTKSFGLPEDEDYDGPPPGEMEYNLK
jgi:hypothetical protein